MIILDYWSLLDVDVDFLIVAIAKISHAEMNYELSLFFRQSWHDPVLEKILTEVTKENLKYRNTTILLDPSMADKGFVQNNLI